MKEIYSDEKRYGVLRLKINDVVGLKEESPMGNLSHRLLSGTGHC